MMPTKDQLGGVVTTDPAGSTNSPERAAADSGASIDKVRDILFGNQVREFERRFARLEERMLKETNDLKEDMQTRLAALEQYARKENESLADQIRAEQQDRLEANSGLSRELQETARSLERRTTTLDDQLTKSQRELRQQLLDQHQRLTDDIRRKVDDVLARLARETQELRSDKADRTILASLLTEMAMRLTNDGAEDAGNG
jgi:uncharacterized protein YoxC